MSFPLAAGVIAAVVVVRVCGTVPVIDGCGGCGGAEFSGIAKENIAALRNGAAN